VDCHRTRRLPATCHSGITEVTMIRRIALCFASLAAIAAAAPVIAHPGHHHDDSAAITAGVGQPPNDVELLFEAVAGEASARGAGLQAERFGTWGVDLSQQIASVKPGDDFYRFVNGRWLDTFEIPADRGDYGSFNALAELSDRRVKAIVDDATSARRPSVEQQQIGALYAAFMDTARLDRLGLAPLQPYLASIDSATDNRSLALVLARTPGMPLPVSPFVSADRRDTTRNQLGIWQGGLGMPERDFYLSDGSNYPQVREAYSAYNIELLLLTGAAAGEAAERAEAVLAFERKIAEAHFTRTDNRDPTKTLNPRTLRELEREAPGMPWRDMMVLAGVDLSKVTDINVFQPSAATGIARAWSQADLAVLKDWARLQLMRAQADNLSEPFREAAFAYQRVSTGQTEQRSRDKRGGDLIDEELGAAVGRIYVQKYFGPEARLAMDELVANVKAAVGRRLDALEWMSPATKAEARAKLAAFTVKVGVPEVWDDKSSVRISRTDLVGNMMRLAAWEQADNLGRLGKPVDKREWGMTPQTVNAYYNPTNNEIVFPAAILQPPFFDAQADPAVNYGGIGAVIGHEILHGFDDQGRRFAADGAQRDWWTAEDDAQFKARSDRLVEQYNGFEPLPGLFVNGRISLGENIADLGGMTVAYEAWKASLNGAQAPVLDGVTGPQRFFMGWAQVWRFKARDERMRQRVATAPHSPPQFRTNGVVRNLDAWYEAFDVKPGDKLYLAPEERVRLW
jgi:putative endopeptidase